MATINGLPAKVFKNKAGMKVFVIGGKSEEERLSRGKPFVKYINSNYTVSELKSIGNVVYDLTSKIKKSWAAHSAFLDVSQGNINHGRNKIFVVNFDSKHKNNEWAITHEMIHALKSINKQPHNEKKIDFETVGRVSQNGLKITENNVGEYFSDKRLKKDKTITKPKRRKILKEEIDHDRILLTGSLPKKITGVVAQKRSNSLYPQSFFKRNIKHI